MRLEGQRNQIGQRHLAERVVLASHVPLREKPTADVELEAMFVRAASAWARWRERQRWGGS